MSFPIIPLQPPPPSPPPLLISAALEHEVDSIEIEPTILTGHKAVAIKLMKITNTLKYLRGLGGTWNSTAVTPKEYVVIFDGVPQGATGRAAASQMH